MVLYKWCIVLFAALVIGYICFEYFVWYDFEESLLHDSDKLYCKNVTHTKCNDTIVYVPNITYIQTPCSDKSSQQGTVEIFKDDAPLKCVEGVKNTYKESTASLDPIFQDIFDLFLEYGLTESAQARYYKNNVQRGRYFNSARELQDKLAAHQTCWASDEKIWSNEPKKHKYGVCTMQDATGPYIQEWVSHYLLMGFHKVVIMDTSAAGHLQDEFYDSIKPFVEAQLVQVIHKDFFDNIGSFDECRKLLTGEGFDWIAQFDTDEFLLMHDPMPRCIGEFLKRFEDKDEEVKKIGGLVVRWRMMSTVGAWRNRPTNVLLEESLYHDSSQSHASSLAKTIYRTSKVASVTHPHYVQYIPGYIQVDVYFNDQASHNMPFYVLENGNKNTFEHAELRHFYGRSLENMMYDKVCANNKVSPQEVPARFKAVLEWYKKDAQLLKLDPPTKFSEPLKKFLF